MSDDGLERLAAEARRYFRWAMFGLAAMTLILVIDLQLKKSIGRQAVRTSERLAEAASLVRGTERIMEQLRDSGGRAESPGAPDGDPDHPRGGPGPGLAGDAGMAAADDSQGGTAKAAAAGRRSRPGKRLPGDGQ